MLEEQLRLQENQKLRPILFEGQGIGRVFSEHRRNLSEKLKAGEFAGEAPKIQEIVTRLEATATLVQNSITRFKAERVKRYLENISDKGKLREGSSDCHPRVADFVNNLYENVFMTVAFQSALIAGFFGELERADRVLVRGGKARLDLAATFAEYTRAINSFFAPTTSTGLRHLVECFAGQLEGELREWKLATSLNTFRQVVYRGEMQPDQWPKYKYLILEIWNPSNEDLSKSVTSEREKCRDQVFNSLVEEFRKDLLQRLSKREELLTEDERQQVITSAYSAFKTFLQNLGWKISQIPTQKKMLERTTTHVDDTLEEAKSEEIWDSAEGV